MKLMWILFATLFGCSLAATDNKQCQKGGEYCLNHWDCCSNTCLSFLYKCSHILSTDMKNGEAPAAVGFSLSIPAAASPSLSSRFDELIPPSNTEAQHPDTISYQSLLDIIFKPLESQSAPVGRELNSIIPRAEETTFVDDKEFKKPSPATTVWPECLEIGSKCYRNEECCTERCHGYLHQCVT